MEEEAVSLPAIVVAVCLPVSSEAVVAVDTSDDRRWSEHMMAGRGRGSRCERTKACWCGVEEPDGERARECSRHAVGGDERSHTATRRSFTRAMTQTRKRYFFLAFFASVLSLFVWLFLPFLRDFSTIFSSWVDVVSCETQKHFHTYTHRLTLLCTQARYIIVFTYLRFPSMAD